MRTVLHSVQIFYIHYLTKEGIDLKTRFYHQPIKKYYYCFLPTAF